MKSVDNAYTQRAMPGVKTSEIGGLASLADKQDVWQCYVHRLRTWVPNAAGDDVVRPYLTMVISTGDGAFLNCEPDKEFKGGQTNVFTSIAPPTSEEVVEFLERVMLAPKVMNTSMEGDKRGPGKPRKICFCDTATADALRGQPGQWAGFTGCPYVEGCTSALQKHGIETAFAPVPPQVIEQYIRAQIEPNMQPPGATWGTHHLPGLMDSVQGMTPEFGNSLFAAASAFLGAAPWEKMDARRPIKITYAIPLKPEMQMRVTAYVAVTGPEGDEAGPSLAVYKNMDAALAAFEGDEDNQAALQSGGSSCAFFSELDTPYGDVDDASKLGWEVAEGLFAHPCFLKVGLVKGGAEDGSEDTMQIERPGLMELQTFELALTGLAALAMSGDFEARGRGQAGPWGLQMETLAGKGKAEDIRVEMEVTSLDAPDMDAVAAQMQASGLGGIGTLGGPM